MSSYSFNPFTGKPDLVSGTTTTTSSSYLTIYARQSPVESPNGVRVTFTFPHAYVAGSIDAILNGLVDTHFTESPSTKQITFSTAPFTGDEIKARYAVSTAAAPTSTYGVGLYGTAVYA